MTLDVSTLIEFGSIVFTAGGVVSFIRASTRMLSAAIKESDVKIQRLEKKIENGISSNIQQLLTNGAVRDAQLDRLQISMDVLADKCPRVHTVIEGLIKNHENYSQ